MKPWTFLPLALVGWFSVRAQTAPPPTTPTGYAVGLKAGTIGLGLEWGRRFHNPRWQLRAGGSTLRYGQELTISLNRQSNLRLDPDARLTLLGATLDFHPFGRSNFHVSAGLAGNLTPTYTAWLDAPQGIDYEGLVIAGDEFGSIDLRLRWARLLPYLGLGLGRAVPKGRLGGGFDLGGYYLGPPRLRATLTGLIESTTLGDEVPRIEKNLRGYRYLPHLTVHVRYRLTR